MAKTVGVAVIGYGGMGKWHTKRISEIEEVKLLGIFDIKQSQQELAVENGIKAYDSLDELLADSEVEVCTIAIPNDIHKEMASIIHYGINQF